MKNLSNFPVNSTEFEVEKLLGCELARQWAPAKEPGEFILLYFNHERDIVFTIPYNWMTTSKLSDKVIDYLKDMNLIPASNIDNSVS